MLLNFIPMHQTLSNQNPSLDEITEADEPNLLVYLSNGKPLETISIENFECASASDDAVWPSPMIPKSEKKKYRPDHTENGTETK